MKKFIAACFILPLILVSVCAFAQEKIESDSDYLQHRAAQLYSRIDVAVRKHSVSDRKGQELQLAVGKVQTVAGNLQARNGVITRAEADRLNQQLTDVERSLTNQP